MMRARDMYARQYATASAMLRRLDECLRMKPMDRAEYGAIVITDKQWFFLSIGLGKFTVPSGESPTGMQYCFAISAQTPIYLAMKGKGIGDSFIVNGIMQTINEIL